MPTGSAGYEPFAWWLAREHIGRDLRERYAVSEEQLDHSCQETRHSHLIRARFLANETP
jgi:hypothetical protein